MVVRNIRDNCDMFWLFKIAEIMVICLGVQNITDDGDMFGSSKYQKQPWYALQFKLSEIMVICLGGQNIRDDVDIFGSSKYQRYCDMFNCSKYKR